MKRFLVKNGLPILVVILFIAGLIVALISIRQTQIIKNKAVTPGGIGSISLSPVSATHYVGELFPVGIKINTGGASVSSIALRLIYKFTGQLPQMVITDSSGNLTNQPTPDAGLLATGDWSFPVKSINTDIISRTVTIDLAAINTSVAGFSSTSDVNLATLYFKVKGVSNGPVALNFDTGQTQMLTKSGRHDILAVPVNGSYTLSNACVTNAPTLSLLPTSQVGNVGKTLNYQFSVTNNNSAACPTETYIINFAPPSSNWTVTTDVANLTISGGVTKTAIISVTPTGSVANGGYTFPVFVVKNSDGLQAGTVQGTYVVSSSTLNFKFRLQGVVQAGPTSNVSLTFKDTTSGAVAGKFNVTAVADANGVYSGSLDLGNVLLGTVTPGTYDVYLKDTNHLQKKFGGVTLVLGNNNVDWTGNPLLASDFDGDNTLNVIDLGKWLSVYNALSVPVTDSNKQYDVNGDGVINIKDFAQILINYTQLSTPGDNY